MKVKYLLLLFLIGISCLSCERKSGRRGEGLNSARKSYNLQSRTQSRHSKVNSRIGVSNKVPISGSLIFEKYCTAVFMVFTSDGMSEFQGSGFFISDDGVAVSNYHVFKGTTKGLEVIKLTDGGTFKIQEVIAYNEDKDYILFRVGLGNHKVNYIPISHTIPRVGEKAYAIGSPRGLENTFSSGEISQIRDSQWLQISVPIDHGSSGGALINNYGEAIGITTAGIDDSGANLNFALSISVLDEYFK